MTPEQLAALVAAVPSVAALIWVIVRQQTQIDRFAVALLEKPDTTQVDRLIEALLKTQDTLLKLHPPQTPEAAKQLAETAS